MTTKFSKLRVYLKNELLRLNEELVQLEASANSVEDRREGSPFGKREEEATEALELEKRLALEKRVKDQSAEIEHALLKFKDGSYGVCDICGELIDPARLKALPQASVCMNCKAQQQAKNGKGKAPSSL